MRGTTALKRRQQVGAEKHPAKQVRVEKHSAKQVRVEKHPDKQVGAEKYTAKQVGAEKHPAKQVGKEKHPAKQVGIEKHLAKQVEVEKYPAKQVRVEKHPAKQVGAEKYTAKQVEAEKHPAKQVGAEKHPAKQVGIEKHPAKQVEVEKYPAKQVRVDKHPAKQVGVEKYTAEQDGLERYIASVFHFPCLGAKELFILREHIRRINDKWLIAYFLSITAYVMPSLVTKICDWCSFFSTKVEKKDQFLSRGVWSNNLIAKLAGECELPYDATTPSIEIETILGDLIIFHFGLITIPETDALLKAKAQKRVEAIMSERARQVNCEYQNLPRERLQQISSFWKNKYARALAVENFLDGPESYGCEDKRLALAFHTQLKMMYEFGGMQIIKWMDKYFNIKNCSTIDLAYDIRYFKEVNALMDILNAYEEEVKHEVELATGVKRQIPFHFRRLIADEGLNKLTRAAFPILSHTAIAYEKQAYSKQVNKTMELFKTDDKVEVSNKIKRLVEGVLSLGPKAATLILPVWGQAEFERAGLQNCERELQHIDNLKVTRRQLSKSFSAKQFLPKVNLSLNEKKQASSSWRTFFGQRRPNYRQLPPQRIELSTCYPPAKSLRTHFQTGTPAE